MVRFSLILIASIVVEGFAVASPVDAVSQAHADLVKISSGQEHYRYLSLYNIPPELRELMVRVLSGHCNGLSREPDLVPVSPVKGTAGALVRINLADYQWDTATWEKLVDPYFTVTIEATIETPWEGGVWRADGRFYQAGSFRYRKTVKTQALAPWLSETDEQRKKLAEVVSWTKSKMPVVRADWFFNQTAAAVDRSPNYYDFLGIKDERGFQKLIGADVKLAEEFGAELREAVAISGVTLHPRAIARHGTIAGAYWRTFDFAATKGGKNPLRTLGRDIEKDYDASEQYGHLPNGLWATGLFDKAGKTQATAPDSIASDGHSKSNDRRVHVNVSCMRCHSKAGVQDIAGWVRNLMTPPLELRSTNYDKARELRRQYARKLEPFIAKDRATFEDAVKSLTGMNAEMYALAYSQEWERYEDAKIGLAEAAIDLGVPVERWRQALDAKVRTGAGDTVLSVMLLNNPRLNRVPIRVWEEKYAEAHLFLRGFQQ